MEIIGLGELLVGKEEGSTTYGAGLTRESRPKDPKELPEVELTGLRFSHLSCIAAVLISCSDALVSEHLASYLRCV